MEELPAADADRLRHKRTVAGWVRLGIVGSTCNAVRRFGCLALLGPEPGPDRECEMPSMRLRSDALAGQLSTICSLSTGSLFLVDTRRVGGKCDTTAAVER